ncbi:unnamed protein product, partial [Prorocentrum cordatum]
GPAGLRAAGEEDSTGDVAGDEYDTFEMPSAEVLDAWEQDEVATEIFKNFQQEGLEGTTQLGFRDVATLLEVLGVEREQFVEIFTEDVIQEVEYLDEEETD